MAWGQQDSVDVCKYLSALISFFLIDVSVEQPDQAGDHGMSENIVDHVTNLGATALPAAHLHACQGPLLLLPARLWRRRGPRSPVREW